MLAKLKVDFDTAVERSSIEKEKVKQQLDIVVGSALGSARSDTAVASGIGFGADTWLEMNPLWVVACY